MFSSPVRVRIAPGALFILTYGVTTILGLNQAAIALANAATAPSSSALFIVLTQPVKIKILYGETVLPAGLKLPVVSNDSENVRVDYMGEVQTIPVTAVRFESAARQLESAIPPPPPVPLAPSAPSSSKQRTIYLRAGYDSRMQGGDTTMRELHSLLSPHCAAGVNLGGEGINIYSGVRYLMDAGEAANILGLRGIPSRVQLATPGFPRSSMYYIAYDGAFEGHFNRIYLVTDAANQVTVIQLVDEHPKRSCQPPLSSNWMTYNFINARMRASTAVRVRAESKHEGDIVRIETSMCQRDRHNWEEKENTKLVLPLPFAQIVLHCVEIGLSNR